MEVVSFYWMGSVCNQVTIQPQQYLVLGQIKQKYLVEMAILLNHWVLSSTVTASLLTQINEAM